MASLAETLRRRNQAPAVRDQQGQLTEQGPEEMQSLAQKAGLAATPLTPGGAAALGGNPDQAKMAGTPQQKQSALTMATSPKDSLQTALRQQQVRDSANQAEQQSQQKSESLKALGGVGDRVNDFIENERKKLQAQATQALGNPSTGQAGSGVAVQTEDQFQGKDVSGIKDLLSQLRTNPNDMNLQLKVNQALGYDVKTQLSPDQINQLYEDSVTSISRGGADAVANGLTVGDLIDVGNLGYTKDSLAQLLGISPEEAAGMTVSQLHDKIGQVQAEEFSKSSELDRQASSGQLGQAERQLARQGGREASRVGTRSSEADVQNLEQQISRGDQVTFGGQQYTVENLLKDDTISGIISDYLNSAEGSPERAQLEKSEPEMAAFIKNNQALLHDASEKLSGGAQQFSDIQKYNRELVQGLPDNLAKVVAPEAQSLSSGKINVQNKPLLQAIQQNPALAQHLQGVDDQDAQVLGQLSLPEIQKLGIGQPGGIWANYQQDKAAVQQVRNRLTQAQGNPDEIVDVVFNGAFPGGLGQLQGQYDSEKKKAALGLPNSFDQVKGFDTNHDGQISAEELSASVRNNASGLNLQQALAGNRRQQSDIYLPDPGQPAKLDDGIQKKVYDRLGSALADGSLSVQEVMDNSADFSDDEIRSLEDILNKSSKSGLVSLETGEGGLKERLDRRIEDRDSSKRDADRAAKEAADRAAHDKALADWTSKYGNLQQDRFGRWGRIVNGMWSGASAPPPRP